ncbi:hypothetical protein GCM10027515_08560 [Schumannella luteola]
MLSADEVIDQIHDDVRANDERAARMPAFTAAIGAVRGVAVSAARDIRVETDSTGHVTGIEISETALTGGARKLSREILQTINAAELVAKRKAVQSVAQLLGDDDPITLQLGAELSAREAALTNPAAAASAAAAATIDPTRPAPGTPSETSISRGERKQ